MHTICSCYLAVSAFLFSITWSLPVETHTAQPGPFTGYQVLEIHLKNVMDMGSFLQELETGFQVDVWGRPAREAIDVMVSPQQLGDIFKFLEGRNTTYKIKVEDVQRLLDEHMESVHHHPERRSADLSLPLSSVTRRYLTFPQIKRFLRSVQGSATDSIVNISSIGLTFEGRATPYVTIRERNSSQTDKRVVIIEAGIHAREWIAPAMALNIIYRLAVNPNDDPDIGDLVQKFDWVVVPVLNPDGYVYSHQNSSTRLWRKTRTTMYSNDPHCLGVDANRNFGYEWSDSVFQGGNSNPCMDNYSGPRGFSEPETRNLKYLLQRLRGNVALYLSLHSYGQFFLYPWGYDAMAPLEDEADMREIGQRFSETMRRRHRWYEIGSSAKVLYTAAGASDDYARGGAGIKYAFTVELSPTDSSPHGFLLPAHHISSVVNDHWPAFKTIVMAIWNKLNTTDVSPTITDNNQTDNNSHVSNDNDNTSSNFISDDHESDASLSDNSIAAGRQQSRFSRRGSNSVREEDDNFSDSLTEVMIDGRILHVNLNDPTIAQYIEFLNYRRQLRQQDDGKNYRR